MSVLYREAGRMDYLCTVGALHQGEGWISTFLLIGLLADLTHCRQGKARLEGTEDELLKQTHLTVNKEILVTYRETLSQNTGLLELPRSSKLLHVSAEVTVSTLWSHTGFTALTPAERENITENYRPLILHLHNCINHRRLVLLICVGSKQLVISGLNWEQPLKVT